MSAVTDTAAADAGLREARRERVFAAMDEAGLDALVLHRRDTIAYASGAARLWTAGTRPFSASGVLVGSTRGVHLLSTWDEGVPPEIPFDHLFGLSWNPAILARSVAAIPGLAAARRVGVDGLSVGFDRMLRRLADGVEIVPADDRLQAVRTEKLPAELDRIRAACAVAATAVDAASSALSAGATPAAALDAAVQSAADRGVTIPSSAPVVEPVGEGGHLVHVDVGILLDDYEGGRGRTVALPGAPADAVAALSAAEEAHERLVAACRPGATATDLRAAAGDLDAGLGSWRVRGTGLGFELPVITPTLGPTAVLHPAMALSVETPLHRTIALL